MNDSIDPGSTSGPARPEKLVSGYFEEPDGIAVRAKQSGGPGCFMLLWLIGWTVGCVALIVHVVREPEPFSFLFALPFWASWLAVASFLVWLQFGRETLLLRRDEALFLRTAWIPLTERKVPRSEIRGFRQCRSSYTENDQHLWGIEMTTLGKPVRFGFRLPDQERAWLIHQLNCFLPAEESAATGDSAGKSPAASLAVEEQSDASVGSREVLTYQATLEAAPSDCSWQLEDNFQDFVFWEGGQLRWGTVAGMVFLNAFWNGIVSVFVLLLWGFLPNANQNQQPQGWGWWGLFVFLIPFEVIGLAMLTALLLALLDPFRRTEWTFGRQAIERRLRYPLFSRRWSWQVAGLDRLELRGPGENAQHLKNGLLVEAEGTVELVFVTRDNTELCTLDGLSEGEARWLAREIFDRRGDWFVDSASGPHRT